MAKRVERAWLALEERIGVGDVHPLAWPLAAFQHWYTERLMGFSDAHSWASHLRADEEAAKTLGSLSLAKHLVTMKLIPYFLNEVIQPTLDRRAQEQLQPDLGLFVCIQESFCKEWPHTVAGRRFEDEVNSNALLPASSPHLRERLRRLGVQTPTAEVLDFNRPLPHAVKHWLSDDEPQVMSSLFALWWERHRFDWRHKYDETQRVRTALETFRHKPAATLTEDDLIEKALLLYRLGEPGQALTTTRQILENRPDHAIANLLVGFLLLEVGDSAGMDFVQKASDLSPTILRDAERLLTAFNHGRGQVAEALGLLHMQAIEREVANLSLAQSGGLSEADFLEPHQLSTGSAQNLRESVKANPAVTAAYLVRKDAHQLLVLCLDTVGPETLTAGVRQAEDFHAQIYLPAGVRMIVLDRTQGRLRRCVEKVPGSLLFRR